MPQKDGQSKKYIENMMLYGAKHQPTSDEILELVAKNSIKEPWPESGNDVEFRKWLREQWLLCLMQCVPKEAEILMKKFPFLHQCAFLVNPEKVKEFRDYVDSNLKFPKTMQQFPLLVEHSSDRKFVEMTIQHFFSEGMAELIIIKWKDTISLTGKFASSVARFILFRGVTAECHISSSIVASEVKLTRYLLKHEIDIKMSTPELHEFCKTTVARKLFWLIVGLYATFEKGFDRGYHEDWGFWFEKAMHLCSNDDNVQKFREYVIHCEKQCHVYFELLVEKEPLIKRLKAELGVIIWKESRAMQALQTQYDAKRLEGDYSAAGRINGAMNDHKVFRDNAQDMLDTKLAVRSLNGVYVNPQITLGADKLTRVEDPKIIDAYHTSLLDEVEMFIGIGKMIMGDLRTVGEIFEDEDVKKARELQAKKNEDEERRRRDLIAQNGLSLASREAALAYIGIQCTSVSSSTPTPDFMFGIPASRDPRSVLDHINQQEEGADLSDLLGDDEGHDEAVPSFAQAVLNVDAVNAAVASTVEKMVQAIEETEKDREINEKTEAAVEAAVEAALDSIVGEIQEAYTAERIQYRRSVRNVLKTFNRVKNSIVEDIHSMRVEFGIYRDKVEQERKKIAIVDLVSEIRSIQAELTEEIGTLNAVASIATKDKKQMFTLAAYRIFPDFMLKIVTCDLCDSPVDMSLDCAFNPRSNTFSCYCCILINHHSDRLQLEHQITRLIKSVRRELDVSEYGFDLQDSGNPLSHFPFDYTQRVFLATAPMFVPLAMHTDDVQCPICLDSLAWNVDKDIGFPTCCAEYGFVCGNCIKSPKPHCKDHQSFAADYEIARVMAEVRSKVGI